MRSDLPLSINNSLLCKTISYRRRNCHVLSPVFDPLVFRNSSHMSSRIALQHKSIFIRTNLTPRLAHNARLLGLSGNLSIELDLEDAVGRSHRRWILN